MEVVGLFLDTAYLMFNDLPFLFRNLFYWHIQFISTIFYSCLISCSTGKENSAQLRLSSAWLRLY